MNPHYQAIIGMGAPAVPFLLRELEKAPDHLGWALMAITRENPVTAAMSGDLKAQAAAWVAWGRRNGKF